MSTSTRTPRTITQLLDLVVAFARFSSHSVGLCDVQAAGILLEVVEVIAAVDRAKLIRQLMERASKLDPDQAEFLVDAGEDAIARMASLERADSRVPARMH